MYITDEQASKLKQIEAVKGFVSKLYPFPQAKERDARFAFLAHWDEDNLNNEITSFLSHAFSDCLDRINECIGQVNELESVTYQLVILNLMKTLNIELPFDMREETNQELYKELETLINNL